MRQKRATLLFCLCTITGWLGLSSAIPLYADQLPTHQQLVGKLPANFDLRTLHTADGNHRYAVYIPSGTAPTAGWPVVLFLHGAGERGSDGIAPLSVGLGTALEAQPQPFIAVFPQNENQNERYLRGWDATGTDTQRALQILAAVEAQEHTDPTRRALVGWSMGGYGAWGLAAAMPEKWSAILALSGGAVSELNLESLAKAGTPVWAIHGATDTLVSADQSKRLTQKLQQLGGGVRLDVLPDVGHDVWRFAFAQPELMRWLIHPKEHVTTPVNWHAQPPLPPRSRFYTNHFAHVTTAKDVISIRLGNSALASIAEEALAAIPASALSGELEDITRSLDAGEDRIDVALSNLQWNCQLAQCQLRGIHSGRFLIELELKPIAITIGKTTLSSQQHSARVGPFKIVIGHLEPVTVRVEVQPDMQSGKLKLLPLRSAFQIPDHNWYISHPQDVEVHSDTFTAFHVTTGIVGSLYQQREELEQQVLHAVPALLTYLERNLQQQPAPQLAQLLWPLPVLVPDIELAPSQVRTDANGVSLVLDLLTTTYNCTDASAQCDLPQSPINVREIERTQTLDATVALDVVRSLSAAVTSVQKPQINILDLPDGHFHTLTDHDTITQLFPDESMNGNVEAVLQLNGPFQFTQLENPHDSTGFLFHAPAAGVRYLLRHADNSIQPLGTFHFTLRQRITTNIITDASEQQLVVDWAAPVELTKINYLAETREQGRNQFSIQSNSRCKAFQQAFTNSWNTWAKSQSQSQPLPELTHGPHPLRLHKLNIRDQRLHLRFDSRRRSPRHLLDQEVDQAR